MESTQAQLVLGAGLGLLGIGVMHWMTRDTPARLSSPETVPKLRGFTKEELRRFDGSHGGPVYISVKRRVYSVAPNFYGVGGPYACFAAKDCSRNLGKSQISDSEANADWTTLSADHISVLNDWDEKFRMKYDTVGWLIPDDEYYRKGAEFDP